MNTSAIITNIKNKFVLTDTNVKFLSDYISTIDVKLQKKVLFEIVNDVVNNKINKNYNTIFEDIIINNIKNDIYGWNNIIYNDIRKKIEEQDNFLINPFEVEEGVLECHCGSKRVLSYSRQVRSCDEGTSVFATCIACKSSWIYSG
jgi:DNA-directed RNA polymerase subunit M/transcription elongation factor TFIIS